MNFGIRKIQATRAAGFARSSDHSLIEQDHSPVAKTGNLIHRKTCFQVSAGAGERVFAMGGERVGAVSKLVQGADSEMPEGR